MRGLTGQELAAWERAGLFVRRAAIQHTALARVRPSLAGRSAGAIDEAAWAGVAELLEAAPLCEVIADLLGASAGVERIMLGGDAGDDPWRRHAGPAPTSDALSQASALAGIAGAAILAVALDADHSIVVLPGTHIMAPAPCQLAAMAAGDRVDGQVPVRLGAGDIAAMSPCLLRRGSSSAVAELWLKATDRGAAHSAPTLADDTRLSASTRGAFAMAIAMVSGRSIRR